MIRILCNIAALIGLACVSSVQVQAQAPAWPAKPIRLVVPYSPGGPTDVIARQIAVRLSTKLGQPVLVENRAGAGGGTGVEGVIRSAPDGYTLALVAPGPVAGMRALTKLPYTQAEIQYLTLVARSPSVVAVNGKLGINSLDDLLKLSRSKPGSLNFASAGSGTTPHIAGELLKQEARLDVVHVPYKGSGPAATALIAGEVQFTVNDLLLLLPHVAGGGVKILAIAGSQRVPQIPEVPTTGELGLPKVVMETHYGVIGPVGMPAAVQKKIRDTVVEIVGTAEMKDILLKNGGVPVVSSAEEYRDLMQSEYEKWRGVAERGNIKVD
jgi:tripartite-type tricarboxylate transporter receptor subunit TctC